MKRIIKYIKIISTISAIVAAIAFLVERINEIKNRNIEKKHRPFGIYERFIKRPLDVFLSTGALIVFSPILLITAILVKSKLGSPVIFTQERPGKIDPMTGKSKIFKLYKFRTMTDEKDKFGKLLSDDLRLTSFGKKMRSTSLDELPELINIIKGDMAVVGPRPLLVRYLDRYNEYHARRHVIRPGFTGLAQVNGRTAANWGERLGYDTKYVKNISLKNDVKIIFETVKKVFVKSDIVEAGCQGNFDDYRRKQWEDGIVAKPDEIE